MAGMYWKNLWVLHQSIKSFKVFLVKAAVFWNYFHFLKQKAEFQ